MRLLQASITAVLVVVGGRYSLAGTGQGPMQKIDDSGLGEGGGGGFDQCRKGCDEKYLNEVRRSLGLDPAAASVILEAARKRREVCYSNCATAHDD